MIKKLIVAIPARLNSKRLPNKVLKDINGAPMLKRVLDRCSINQNNDQIIVCTDSEKIIKNVKQWGYKVKLTSANCDSGSHRIATVIDEIIYELWNFRDEKKEISLKDYLENTLVINVQGDQPFFDGHIISKMYEIFLNNPKFQIITPIYQLKKEDIHNPNVVKTLISKEGKALYFSRSAIPHVRGIAPSSWNKYYSYWGHVGLYGYKASILSNWDSIPSSKLEKLESLEQLRFIDSGFIIDTLKTDSYTISVDTKEQLEEARSFAIKIEKNS